MVCLLIFLLRVRWENWCYSTCFHFFSVFTLSPWSSFTFHGQIKQSVKFLKTVLTLNGSMYMILLLAIVQISLVSLCWPCDRLLTCPVCVHYLLPNTKLQVTAIHNKQPQVIDAWTESLLPSDAFTLYNFSTFSAPQQGKATKTTITCLSLTFLFRQ